ATAMSAHTISATSGKRTLKNMPTPPRDGCATLPPTLNATTGPRAGLRHLLDGCCEFPATQADVATRRGCTRRFVSCWAARRLLERQRRAEAQAQQRSAAGVVARLREAAARLRRLTHDCEPEARAGLGARVARAVEAI